MKQFIAFLFLCPLYVSADWIKSSDNSKVKCRGEFSESNITPVIWRNGDSLVFVCAYEKKSGSLGIQVDSAFSVESFINGKSQIIATEPEVGAHPLSVDFKGNKAVFTTYSDQSEFRIALYKQELACDTKCILSKKVCALVPNAGAQALITKVEKAFANAPSNGAKLVIWSDYFYEGSHMKEGQLIIAEAMRGNKKAEKLVLTAPGADASKAESLGYLRLKIEAAKEVCSKP